MIYHVVLQPEVPLVYGGDSYLLDFNGDGVGDVEFATRSQQAFAVYPRGTNAVLAIPAAPPDLGSFGMRLTGGEAIGSTPPNGAVWIQTFTAYGLEIGPGLTSCMNFNGQLFCLGYFTVTVGDLGARFQVGNDTHYGWVLLQGGAGNGWIKEYAYNMVPGEPILAGAVPEPGVVTLFALSGLVAFILFRRRP
jgi:hypothetical protein